MNDRATFASVNPATGEVLGEVADITPSDAAAAVGRAADALDDWRSTPVIARSRVIRRCGELMLRHASELSGLITAEQGKPLGEAGFEVLLASEAMFWFAEEARRTFGRTIPDPMSDRRLATFKQPVGVVLAITPWNIPLLALPRKVAAALAAGCPVLLKPAEQTPLVAMRFADLLAEAGLPDGALTVVTTSDPGPVAAAMIGEPHVRKISFTGSTEVGRDLLASAAHRVTNVTLELGGNAPAILFDDADLDVALNDLVGLKTQMSGQNCLAPNRFYAQRDIYDEVVERLARAAEHVVVGDGARDGVRMGPLIDAAALAKVERHVSDALARGAVLRAGGRRLTGGEFAGGCFYPPTVLSDVPPDALAMTEETFGPVYAVAPFTDEDEVIAEANRTESGLAAYVYTQRLSRAMRVAERLEFGMVAVNENRIASTEAPFGGVKAAGLGRESGHEGIEAYLETKTLAIRL